MNNLEEKYDIIVVGAGHAGCEAALAAARMGFETICFTVSMDSVALMPCNPNIGGSSKGHLVKEIDALGGEMGKNIDKTYLQSKMLNKSKGPAVHSLRAQADKKMYSISMTQVMGNTPNLTLRQGEVTEILVEDGKIKGVKTYSGAVYYAKAVVLTTGTYLKARCIYGEVSNHTGPNGLQAANYLTDAPYTMEDPHEDVQPFYDKETDSFSWRHYKEKTGFHPDAIELFLGTNGLDVDPTENGDNIAAIVKNIHEEDPDLPIYLVHTIYPANQDGIGSWNNKGYALYGDRYKYEEDQKVFHLMTYLEDILADEPYLYFVPASICVDSANNFDMTEEPVNPYSDEMQEVPTDAVHPGRAAYEQIADCLYSVICGTESEWE